MNYGKLNKNNSHKKKIKINRPSQNYRKEIMSSNCFCETETRFKSIEN